MPSEISPLRSFTSARVGLGRCGTGLPTREVLDFRLAHARARDAVLIPADLDSLAFRLNSLGLECLQLRSRAPDRQTYVARPDLGRLLSDESQELLASVVHGLGLKNDPPDLALTVCDGLSGAAVDSWVFELLEYFLPYARERNWSLAPVSLARHGRVALGDGVGEALNARMTIVLVGERPGLGSADSLGAYITYAPRTGTLDSNRNCISNIRAEGLPPKEAAMKLAWLVEASLRLGLTGTALKDESPCQASFASLCPA